MKKRIILLYYLSLLVFLELSCNNSLKEEYKYNIDLNDKNKITELQVDSIIYIPLKSDKAFIINIDKIIYFDSLFYIFDRRANSIFIFNKQGELKNIINKIGKGPTEYNWIMDFYVDNEGKINIYDSGLKKILKYDVYGKYLSQKKIFLNAWNIINIDDNLLCVFHPRQDNLLNCVLGTYDLKKYEFKELIKARKGIDYNLKNYITFYHLYKSKDLVLFNNYFSNIIYAIKENALIPYCKVSIKSFSREEQMKLVELDSKEFNKEAFKRTLLITSIYETNNFITFTFYKGGENIVFYSKKTGKYAVFTFFGSRKKKFYGNIFNIDCLMDENFVFHMIPVYTNDDLWNKFLNDNSINIINRDYLIENKKEEVNPILIIMKIKKF